MKKILALALATVMTFTLSACGSSESTDTAGADTTGTDTTATTNSETSTVSTADKLTVAIWDTNQQAGLQTIMDEWTKTSGVQVEIQVISWNEYWTLLEAGASGGSLPDVFWMHSNQAQKYMENDMLLDLTDLIEKSDVVDLENYYADIVSLYASEGKQYAVPKDIDTIGLWYNKDMFDEAGLDYPDDTWTWEDLYAAAKVLTKEDGSQYGYAVNTSNNQDSFYNTIYSYGGYVLNDEKTASGFDDPKTIEAMNLIEKMIQEGIVPSLEVLSENGTEVLFQSGKAAMITQGSWMVPAFRDNEYTAAHGAIAKLPTGPDGTRVSIYNGLGWAASANGSNTEAAWSLMEYLGSKEAQLQQAELGVTMSAYKGTSEAWVNGVTCFDLQPYIDMLDAKLIFRPYSKLTTTWEDMITQELKTAWTGEESMADVCNRIAKSMNETLAEE